MQKSTFGVIISNRSFFPDHLVTEGREAILRKLKKMGYDIVILSEQDTPLGAVVTLVDAKKCAALFQKNREKIDGIIVCLPNFGEEIGIASAIEMSKLEVPILVQACDDDPNKLDLANRNDSFCGKLSVCNSLYQRGIKFTNTTLHTCSIDSNELTNDIERFEKICRVVKRIRTARIGVIGTRPNAFQTVRYSEKLLQASGITVSPVDLSEIIFKAQKMSDNERVSKRVAEIKTYGKINAMVTDEKIVKQAKLSLTLEKWIDENECDASAIQCWDSLENNYGCAACLSMSMMGEKGKPSACETDVTGALSMYVLHLASGQPSGYLDWNNNFTDNRDICISQHCSNFPKSFFGTEFEIGNLDILGTTIGPEKCFGALKAQVVSGPMTFIKISTDDIHGKIKTYIGEGEFLDQKINSFGGLALCKIPNLQKLMNYICQNGYEHHVAMNRSLSAGLLEEALGKYLGWEVYLHS
ncbi:MAG TPA: fucose isomerase [Firmicutes bacterium]|jgi:L-fucose isomerase-like protein|nr:fucose isomerase [Bacillota bacterium]